MTLQFRDCMYLEVRNTTNTRLLSTAAAIASYVLPRMPPHTSNQTCAVSFGRIAHTLRPLIEKSM